MIASVFFNLAGHTVNGLLEPQVFVAQLENVTKVAAILNQTLFVPEHCGMLRRHFYGRKGLLARSHKTHSRPIEYPSSVLWFNASLYKNLPDFIHDIRSHCTKLFGLLMLIYPVFAQVPADCFCRNAIPCFICTSKKGIN